MNVSAKYTIHPQPATDSTERQIWKNVQQMAEAVGVKPETTMTTSILKSCFDSEPTQFLR